MKRRRLDNYLKKYRTQKGFSQEHVAYILGFRNGATISRRESFLNTPSLQEALAYEYIYQVPARELFMGMYEEAQAKARFKMERLANRLAKEKPKGTFSKRQDRRLVATLQSHLYNQNGHE